VYITPDNNAGIIPNGQSAILPAGTELHTFLPAPNEEVKSSEGNAISIINKDTNYYIDNNGVDGGGGEGLTSFSYATVSNPYQK
jgi:hypothetical protein